MTFSRYQKFIDRLQNSAIEGPAALQTAHRRTIFRYAYSLSIGTPDPDLQLSQSEKDLVALICYSSNQISDNSTGALVDQGYSEDQILELMYCAALAAGVARYDRAKSLLSAGGE